MNTSDHAHQACQRPGTCQIRLGNSYTEVDLLRVRALQQHTNSGHLEEHILELLLALELCRE